MSITAKTLESLFISKVRIKALHYFFMNPEKQIHLRGAVREFDEEINAVRRELNRMEEVKLIKLEDKGNRKYYELNGNHPFISELLAIFHKSFGIGGELINNQRRIGEIEYAFLTPAYTKGVVYGMQVIDLVIVGSVDLKTLEDLVSKVQYELSKEIHYMVLKPSEFQLRKRRKDQLLMDLMVQDIVMLIGNREEFIR